MALSALDGARAAYENLNERERRLVLALGVVLVVLVVFLPLYLLTSSVSDIEDENQQIQAALREISQHSGELAEWEAQREAAEQQYRNPAPPLGSFLEAKAREAGYDRPLEVTDQPEKVASGFTRRNTRASLPNVDLRTAIEMMVAIENSPYPVAIERLHIEHFQTGDRYNVQLGIVAFDKNRPARGGGGDEGEEAERRPGSPAGPPAPP